MPPDQNPPPGFTVTLAITGASGSVLAQECLRLLAADARVTAVHLVASEASLPVLAEESGISGRSGLTENLLGALYAKVHEHPIADIGPSSASGFFRVDAMLVLPCSMGTL